MNVLSPLMFAAAVLSGTPDLQPPALVPAAQAAPPPAPEQGEGGPHEPVEEQNVVVEAAPLEKPALFTIAPDPELERRYAPREPEPLNRVTIPFQG